MKPTIGRIVHYLQLPTGESGEDTPPRAALIVGCTPRTVPSNMLEEDGFNVILRIFWEHGEWTKRDVPFSEEYARGHWSWPPRE